MDAHPGNSSSRKVSDVYDHHMDDDCQPKDLSLKSNKKLKPIPPPLNLNAPSVLKEFANLATSPKSPLMQKNLPFRKRAYSFSGICDNNQQPNGPTPVPTPTAPDPPESRLSSLHEEGSSSEFLPSPHLVSKRYIPDVLNECYAVRSQYNLNWSPTLIVPVSPSQWISGSSVLLSPAPSSLGSSREELNAGENSRSNFVPSPFPWPLPSWHCFQSGTLVKLETSCPGGWRRVEELSKHGSEFLGALLIEQIEDLDGTSFKITFTSSMAGIVVAQCHILHTFYVKDKGWCANCPDHVLKHFGVSCLHLEPGDVCLPPQKMPAVSPDICDSLKRFSFPPDDNLTSTSPTTGTHCETALSPPSSPCKKLRDPDRPKRPMNAFMLFAKRYRLELIQMHPGKDNRAISVILGESWRNLPQQEREKFVSEARTMAEEQKRLYPDCWKRKRSHSTS